MSEDPTAKHAQNPSAKSFLTDPSSQIATPELSSNTPIAHKAKSHAFLVFLILGVVFGLYMIGFSMLQVDSRSSWTELATVLGVAGLVIGGALYQTGFADIDLWSLVRVYGWYTLPVVGFTFVLFALMQESAVGDAEI